MTPKLQKYICDADNSDVPKRSHDIPPFGEKLPT